MDRPERLGGRDSVKGYAYAFVDNSLEHKQIVLIERIWWLKQFLPSHRSGTEETSFRIGLASMHVVYGHTEWELHGELTKSEYSKKATKQPRTSAEGGASSSPACPVWVALVSRPSRMGRK